MEKYIQKRLEHEVLRLRKFQASMQLVTEISGLVMAIIANASARGHLVHSEYVGKIGDVMELANLAALAESLRTLNDESKKLRKRKKGGGDD